MGNQLDNLLADNSSHERGNVVDRSNTVTATILQCKNHSTISIRIFVFSFTNDNVLRQTNIYIHLVGQVLGDGVFSDTPGLKKGIHIGVELVNILLPVLALARVSSVVIVERVRSPQEHVLWERGT